MEGVSVGAADCSTSLSTVGERAEPSLLDGKTTSQGGVAEGGVLPRTGVVT